MPTALIIGGSGKVAQHLTRLLVAKGHAVHSLIRNGSQSAAIEALGAHPIVQSIEEASVSDLTAIFRSSGADTVIWSAGAGGKGGADRTFAVDRDAAIKSMDAAAKAGVERYIVVSAIDVRDRVGKPTPEWYTEEDKKRSDGMWSRIPAYMAAKLAADIELCKGNARRGLQYTIVRPGALLDDSGTGKISAGKVHFGQGISREDVAATIVACIENPATVGLAFDILGGDIPVETAVQGVAAEKTNTFEGFYS